MQAAIRSLEMEQCAARLEERPGLAFYLFHGVVGVDGKTFACDTTATLVEGEISGSERVYFKTLVHPALIGANMDRYKEVVRKTNLKVRGKLDRDTEHDAGDIIYVTNERLASIDKRVLSENIQEHSIIVAVIAPMVARLMVELGLSERRASPAHSNSAEEEFAARWIQDAKIFSTRGAAFQPVRLSRGALL